MKIHSVLLALTLIGTSGAAMAQWQWLDKDGRKVFSDRAPPPDVAEKSILKRPSSAAKVPETVAATQDESGNAVSAAPAPTPIPGLPSGGLEKELEARKKQVADAELAKRKAEEEKMTKARIENCVRAKQAKATFDSGIRMSRTNASGEREVMDDAARAVELKRLQGIMQSECR